MKHIGIFSNSGDVQTAIQNEDLLNPYVAMVSGALDYNSIEPEPCYLGEWSDNGEGTYTFQILDTGDTAWYGVVNIGQLMGVYFNGDGPINMDVQVQFDGSYTWSIFFIPPGGDQSDGESYYFTEDNPDGWTASTMTSPDESNGISISWDGVDTFGFSSNTVTNLSMTTINPEC